MLSIIAFIGACFLLQAIKDSIRGKRKPTVRLRNEGIHAVAQCGCDTIDNKVLKPCAAHRAMLGGE